MKWHPIMEGLYLFNFRLHLEGNGESYIKEDKNTDKLSLYLTGVHSLYRECLQRQHKVAPDINKIITIIKTAKRLNAPWILRTNVCKRMPALPSPVRVIELKLSAIRQMDLWPRDTSEVVPEDEAKQDSKNSLFNKPEL